MHTPIDWQEVIDNYIRKKEQKEYDMSPGKFRASMLTGCLRQTVILKLNLRTHPIKILRHFQIGTSMHKFIQCKAAVGNLDRPVEFEKELELHCLYNMKTIKITGHCDAWDGTSVYDFKTTSNLDISLTSEMDRAYQLQLSVYGHCLDTERLYIVYVDKRDMKVGIREVDRIPIQDIEKFCMEVDDFIKIYYDTPMEIRKLPEKDGCFRCRMEE